MVILRPGSFDCISLNSKNDTKLKMINFRTHFGSSMFPRPFSVTTQQGSWIASLSLLGALFGGPLGGVLMRYGRKRTLLAVALPFSFCWLLTVFASCVAMMYVTAFGCGFCSAIVLLVTSVHYFSKLSLGFTWAVPV